jgi:hypothetical protein
MPNITRRDSDGDTPTARAIAREYLERDWAPVPVPYREKGPTDRGWQNLQITQDNVADYFDGERMNVGVKLGRASGGLTDVDLDCREALALAELLPGTQAVFGRQSKPASHWLYVTNLWETEQKAVLKFVEPKALARNGAEPATLVELRIGAGDKGAQTIFPGSVHPSGERVRWKHDGTPEEIDGAVLKRIVGALAAGTLLARHYPRGGERHDAALVLGGLLARVPDMEADDIKKFVTAVALVAGDEEAEERGCSAAGAVALRGRGEPTPGLPRMRDVWGADVANTVAKWLGIASDPANMHESIHSWEEPDWSLLDDRRGDLPAFPLDTLRLFSVEPEDWLQKRVERAAHGAGTTVDHVAVPMLGIASSLIGARRRVQASRSWSEPMTDWACVVGFSGTGKTPGIDATRNALEEVVQKRENEIYEIKRKHDQKTERARAAHAKWKKEVEEAVKKGRTAPQKPEEANEPGAFIEPRLYTTDTTIEQLGVLLSARPQGMLLLTDELAGWFQNMSRYSGGRDNDFWLKSWDGRPHTIDRVGRPSLKLQHLLVGVVGGMQDKLAECFKGAADGMYARFLFAWPPEPPYRPLTDKAVEIDQRIVEVLDHLAHLPEKEQRRVPLTEKARAKFERFREKVYGNRQILDGREREWWAKTPTHVLRLAGVLAFIDWATALGDEEEPKKITSQYVTAAVDLILDYFWPHARAALRLVGTTQRMEEARRVLKWLKANGQSEVGREEVRRTALGRRLDADETETVLTQLIRAGWLSKVTGNPGPRGGRPVVRWQVNPFLHTHEGG